MDDPWDDFAATEAGLVRLATKIIALALPTRMAERETTANPLRDTPYELAQRRAYRAYSGLAGLPSTSRYVWYAFHRVAVERFRCEHSL